MFSCTGNLLLAAAVAIAPSASLRAPQQNPCECLNWREAYASGGVDCGDGHEFFVTASRYRMATGVFLPKSLLKQTDGQDVCEGLFMRLNESFCVNVNHANEPAKWSSRQWCYVSPSCPSASPSNGTGTLRIKLCTEAQDKLLRNWEPNDLALWATKNDIDVSTLAKFAYPMEKELQWFRVEGAFGPKSEEVLKELPREWASKLRSIMASKSAVILGSTTDTPPFGIAKGKTAFAVERDDGHRDAQHPRATALWRCAWNCNQSANTTNQVQLSAHEQP